MALTWGQSQELKTHSRSPMWTEEQRAIPGLSQGWQEPRYLSHCCCLLGSALARAGALDLVSASQRETRMKSLAPGVGLAQDLSWQPADGRPLSLALPISSLSCCLSNKHIYKYFNIKYQVNTVIKFCMLLNVVWFFLSVTVDNFIIHAYI